MTDNNDTQDTDLPKFTVNVVPASQVTTEHLSALLARYRRGQIEPLVFGDANVPEAAIIPFAGFVRLLKHDHATAAREEAADQAELSRRVQEVDSSGDPGKELEELGQDLSEPARSMIRKAFDDDE